jgi:signal transduction histidine kinase
LFGLWVRQSTVIVKKLASLNCKKFGGGNDLPLGEELMNFLRNIWAKLSNIGVHDGLGRQELSDVRFSNRQVVALYFTCLPTVAFCYWAMPGQPHYLWLLLAHLCLFFSLWFNYLRHYKTAKIWFSLVAQGLIFWAASTFGKASSMHFIYVLIAFSTIYNFQRYEYKPILGLFAAMTVQIVVLYQTDFSLFMVPNLSETQVRVAEHATIYLCFMGSVVLAKFFIAKFTTQRHLIEEYYHAQEQRFVQLQKANAELDRFVYSISHDLRAPLASVRGLVHLGQRATDLAEAQLYFDLQDKSLHKLNQFIADILDYSRNNRTELQLQLVDFEAEVAQVLELQAQHGQQYAVVPEIAVEQRGEFLTDRHRLQVVLNNLVSNAYRYQNPAQTEPWVRIGVQAGAAQATITVADNGIGIAAEHLPRIFDMFYRAAEGTTGSGLGLYIVKEVVDKLQGSVIVKSEIGRGTEFSLCLPNLARLAVG